MPANDPDVRKAIASKMGRASMASGDPAELTERRRRAAAAVNSPAALARRIVKAFESGAMSRAEKREVREILEAIAPRR